MPASVYQAMGRAAIAAHKAALAEAGYVIVPREPTEAMSMAGWDSGEWDRNNCVDGAEATPAKCWRAMIAAHNP